MTAMIRNLIGLATLAAILASAGCDYFAVHSGPDSQSDGRYLISVHAEASPLGEASANATDVDSFVDHQPNLFPDATRSRDATQQPSGTNAPPILSVTMQSGRIEGLPIGLFSDTTLLMRSNGQISYLPTHEIVSHSVTGQPFVAQGLGGMQQDLQSEFGSRYSIRYASPYLVVAKSGRIGTWCERFQKFHSSMRSYCLTYGIPLRNLDFTLIAIVFESKREFFEYARNEGSSIPSNCVGYYSQKSNRIVLFENDNPKDMDSTLETICHEATHQFAFNAGLHQRLAETPKWLMEGFAVQFEAPAYCNFTTRNHASFWPTSQRQAWDELKSDRNRLQQLFQDLIATDEPFKGDVLNAYTVSWAMNTYLSQRRGPQYVAYLRKMGSMKPFTTYSRGDRMRDFSSAFGSDISWMVREAIHHLDRMR